MERSNSTSSLRSGMQGPVDNSEKDSIPGYTPRRNVCDGSELKLPTEPKLLYHRAITCIRIPIVFLVGTVITPLIELGSAFLSFIKMLGKSATFCCCCCAPCMAIPAILIFAVDIVGAVGYGLITGGYRLVKSTLTHDYSYFDGRYRPLAEQCQKACRLQAHST